MAHHTYASLFIHLIFLNLHHSIIAQWLIKPDFPIVRRNVPTNYSLPPDVIRVGDMLFVTSDFEVNNGTGNLATLKYDEDFDNRWEKGMIPFEIDDSLYEHTPLVHEAMEQYHTYTCVKFIPREDKHENYIQIISKQGCSSFVGNKRRGAQQVSLGRGCLFIGTVVHELGHAVGFYHEHGRWDRDEHIRVHWRNVQQGMEGQFDKIGATKDRVPGPYDINSIMHYGETAFSKDGTSKSMTSLSGQPFDNPYAKNGLGKNDISRINRLYNC